MQKFYWANIGVFALVAATAWPSTAMAQKSKDTLRVGVYQPIKIVDAIFDPNPQTNLMDRMVFDTLTEYDVENRKVIPHLAESWKRIDPVTVDFKLREDVTFHDGSELTAEDVVYTFKFVTDPKVNFRFKGTRFGIYKSMEAVDKFTVRVTTKTPFAPLLTRINALPIFPSDVHSKLPDKSAFGRNPIGTGPYRAEQVEPGKRVVLVKNPNYKHGNVGKPAATIGRIEISQIADRQTQIANLLRGQQDLMYLVPKEVASKLARNPRFEWTVAPTIQFIYFMPDAADRSKFGKFKDRRVREALMHAIDRKALAKALVPSPVAELPPQVAMCHPWHTGCKSTKQPPLFNLAKAKRLLAEAGYPDGFDLQITTWGPSVATAEAVAGQLRKVGVRATVDKLTIGAFVRKRAQGKVQAFVSLWDNGGGQPDVATTAGFFYLPGSRNYNGDAELTKLVKQGQSELDPAKREAIYQKLFDGVTEARYSIPILSIASSVVHTREVVIPTKGHKKPEGFYFNLIKWK